MIATNALSSFIVLGLWGFANTLPRIMAFVIVFGGLVRVPAFLLLNKYMAFLILLFMRLLSRVDLSLLYGRPP